MTETCGIYLLRNAANGKVYVGQSVCIETVRLATKARWEKYRAEKKATA